MADQQQRADNFVNGWRLPFSEGIFSEMTGLPARKYLKGYLESGLVREIEPGIFVTVRSHSWSMASPKDWRFTRESAELVMSALPERSMRRIGREISRSRQWVFRYMEALASLGAVSWDGKNYIKTGTDDLNRLGVDVEKGILSRLKREAREAKNANTSSY